MMCSGCTARCRAGEAAPTPFELKVVRSKLEAFLTRKLPRLLTNDAQRTGYQPQASDRRVSPLPAGLFGRSSLFVCA